MGGEYPIIVVIIPRGGGALIARRAARNRLELLLLFLHHPVHLPIYDNAVGLRLRRGTAAAADSPIAVTLSALVLRGAHRHRRQSEHNPFRGCRTTASYPRR